MDARPLLSRPYGREEGAPLYRFGNAADVPWNGRPMLEAETSALLPVLRRLWEEYPCFYLPCTRLGAWLLGRRADTEVQALIREIVEWPEGRMYSGTAGERLGGGKTL